MSLLSKKYPKADIKVWASFSHSWQDRIDPIFAGRYAYLCMAKGKHGIVMSGFRAIEEQENIADSTLLQHKDYSQRSNGAVYNKNGQCMVAAPGTSNHGRGLAIDDDSEWFKRLSNLDLLPYGLHKPMAYEPWHVEPVETKNTTPEQRDILFYGYMEDYPMDLKQFQLINGLIPDGKIGPKTTAKMVEVKKLIDDNLKK